MTDFALKSITLYNALFDTAILDLQAAEVLSKNKLYAQSIFYLEQSYEKCIKSLYAYYEINVNQADQSKVEKMLRRKYHFGHDTRKVGVQLFKLLSKIEAGRDERSEKLDTAYPHALADYLERFEKMSLPERKVVEQFNKVISVYYRFYKEVQKKASFNSPVGMMMALALALSTCFLNVESFARYPQGKYNYANIRFLSEKQNGIACKHLITMIKHFVNIIPGVVDHYGTLHNID